MKKTFVLTLVALILFGCNKPDTFSISGNISDAAKQMLLIEHLSLNNSVAIDSTLLSEDGKFAFKVASPQYPDFYQLRLGNKRLVLAIDSTESITINTDMLSLPIAMVEGSDKTNQITLLRQSLQSTDIATHKQYAQTVILQNPHSLVAYYALFQRKAGVFVFDIDDANDQKFFSTVATQFDVFMPEYERSKALHKLTINAINEKRKMHNDEVMRQFIEQSDNAFLDIVLPDENGEQQALSQYKGKVFVLDFSAFEMEQSAAYIFELRDLYNQYHKRGVEVFSVSADRSKLVWEDKAKNLPWTTVIATESIFDKSLQTYNVVSLPTMFLFNKRGEVVGRFDDFGALRTAIDRCLR